MIEQSPLLTGAYALSMPAAYRVRGMEDIAVFELFFRKLPPVRRLRRRYRVDCALRRSGAG